MPRRIFVKRTARDVPFAGLDTSQVTKLLAIEVIFKFTGCCWSALHGAILFKTIINIQCDKPFYWRHKSRLMPVIKLLESLGLLSKPCCDFLFLLLLGSKKSNIKIYNVDIDISSGRTTHHLINLIKCPILTCFLNVSKLFWWLDRKYSKVFSFSQAFCKKKGPQVKIYIQHSSFCMLSRLRKARYL